MAKQKLNDYDHYGNTGCRVFKRGTKLDRFCIRINIHQGNYRILRIGVLGRSQIVPKFDFLCQKLRKIPMIFNLENWHRKSNFGTFWHHPLHQFSKFNYFLWVCWFLGKNLSNFVPLENSTIRITIMIMIDTRNEKYPRFDF